MWEVLTSGISPVSLFVVKDARPWGYSRGNVSVLTTLRRLLARLPVSVSRAQLEMPRTGIPVPRIDTGGERQC